MGDDEMARRLALVTGASAGIGEAFARVYAERGYDLALTARRTDRLDALGAELKAKHGSESVVIAADLSDPNAPDAILAAIAERGRVVDALINNAGYGLPGTYDKTSWQEQNAFLQVLLVAVCALAHKTLPGMRERRFGRIVNVASLAGHLPGSSGHTLYAAVKSFLIKFSQSLNLENDAQNVHVTAVCPGFTYSEFHDVNGTRPLVSKMPSWMWQGAREVAELGFAAVERNDAVCVTGGANKAIAALGKLLPDPAALAIMRSQSAKFRNTD
jgi:uncharacterized protein